MADTKISALTDGTTAEDSDRIPVARDPTGSPLSRYVTPLYIITKMLSAARTWLATQTITPAANTSALVSTGGSLTAANAQSLVDLSQTWNTSGAPVAIKLDVISTASSPNSLFLGAYSSGVIQVGMRLDGRINANALFFNSGAFGGDGSWINANAINMLGTAYLGWGAGDVRLYRDAASILAQRNGTNAQTFRVYQTFTDASNYRRLTHAWNTTTALIHNEGAGTGTDGNIAFNDAALATTATTGYIMIPSCAGAPTGVPADIPTGQVALHYDSTGNKLYVYNGAWRSTAALT